MSRERTTVQKLAGNTAWLLLQAAGSKLLSFALNILLVRYLGTAGYGELSFAMAFSGFFTILGDFGLSTYLVKEVAADKAAGPRILGRGLALNVFFSVMTGLLMLASGTAAGLDGRAILLVSLMGAAYLVHQTGAFASAFFRAHEEMSAVFALESLYRLLLLAFCAACVVFRAGLPEIAGAYLAASAVYLACALFVVLRRTFPDLSARFSDYTGMLRESAPYGLSSAVLIIYYNADVVMLSFFRGVKEVGVYSAAYNLYLSLGVITSVYMGAAFPTLARLFKTSPEGTRKAYAKSFKFLMIIGVPVSFGAALLSREIIAALYGAAFAASAPPFAVLSSVTVFLYLNAFLGYFFAAIGRIKDSFFIFCVACSLNIALNFFLIPRLGPVGAACSTVVSEVLYFALAAAYFSRTDYHFMPWGLLLRLGIFASVMGAAVALLRGMNVFALSAAGAALYGLMVLFGGVLDREDIGLIREALHR